MSGPKKVENRRFLAPHCQDAARREHDERLGQGGIGAPLEGLQPPDAPRAVSGRSICK
jgi:hypothetical protein